MANEQAKQKAKALAIKLQGRAITGIEANRIESAIEAKTPRTKADLQEVLSESLGKTAQEVGQILASHDDADRLADEIVNILKGS